MVREELGWKQARPFLRYSRRFFCIAVALFLSELALVPVFSSWLPESWFLGYFLTWRVVKTSELIINGEDIVEVDDVCGWRNRPNSVDKLERIFYDQYGSRSHGGIEIGGRKKRRIVFLGDSRINGWAKVKNHQTINAYLENDTIETLNFGTELFGLDQSYLAMPRIVDRFQPDVFVIGIDLEEFNFLDSTYLPFTRRNSKPLLKPRFVLKENRLQLKTLPIRELMENVPDNPALLEYLREHDNHFDSFERFKKWEFTPFLNILTRINNFLRTENEEIQYYFKTEGWEPISNMPLIKALIKECKTYTDEKQITLVFILLPSFKILKSECEEYTSILTLLETLSIKYVDVKSLLQERVSILNRFYADNDHFTARGNQLIAEALARALED